VEGFVEQVPAFEALAQGVDRLVHPMAGGVDFRADGLGFVGVFAR
jgi:hypothetical protein